MDALSERVYVVDDDARVRDALSALLRANGKSVLAFGSGQDFLDAQRDDVPACLILDMRMPGMNGLEVQKLLGASAGPSIVFITGRGDVPSTVLAMKGGATDFLTKPLDEATLMQAVESALARSRARLREAAEKADLLARYRRLTPREQELLPLLAEGMLNKQAASVLGITEYTVQVHRGHIMKKMEADSFAMLIKQAGRLQFETSRTGSSDG
jgi:FixJ family two-component response regulator